ncbi:unnamed protein product [Caenorhabditis auriculariae]|uniref:Uncharacterized protein n=1 Tax=Caenorhabditis auriculariae TaxID=2777116 RepID=A0A8S1H597_9PELO|nr:unnamed protein product [Caenorhabditis auriculariae]
MQSSLLPMVTQKGRSCPQHRFFGAALHAVRKGVIKRATLQKKAQKSSRYSPWLIRSTSTTQQLGKKSEFEKPRKTEKSRKRTEKEVAKRSSTEGRGKPSILKDYHKPLFSGESEQQPTFESGKKPTSQEERSTAGFNEEKKLLGAARRKNFSPKKYLPTSERNEPANGKTTTGSTEKKEPIGAARRKNFYPKKSHPTPIDGSEPANEETTTASTEKPIGAARRKNFCPVRNLDSFFP